MNHVFCSFVRNLLAVIDTEGIEEFWKQHGDEIPSCNLYVWHGKCEMEFHYRENNWIKVELHSGVYKGSYCLSGSLHFSPLSNQAAASKAFHNLKDHLLKTEASAHLEPIAA